MINKTNYLLQHVKLYTDSNFFFFYYNVICFFISICFKLSTCYIFHFFKLIVIIFFFLIIQVPLCVIVSWIIGVRMDLDFSLLDTGSLVLAIIVKVFTLQVILVENIDLIEPKNQQGLW